CGKKIGPDPRNFNQRVSLGRNDLLIRTFPNYSIHGISDEVHFIFNIAIPVSFIIMIGNCI
ncbi:hypothetical protein L1Q87_04845, partial [Klebsiella pneumoniae]